MKNLVDSLYKEINHIVVNFSYSRGGDQKKAEDNRIAALRKLCENFKEEIDGIEKQIVAVEKEEDADQKRIKTEKNTTESVELYLRYHSSFEKFDVTADLSSFWGGEKLIKVEKLAIELNQKLTELKVTTDCCREYKRQHTDMVKKTINPGQSRSGILELLSPSDMDIKLEAFRREYDAKLLEQTEKYNQKIEKLQNDNAQQIVLRDQKITELYEIFSEIKKTNVIDLGKLPSNIANSMTRAYQILQIEQDKKSLEENNRVEIQEVSAKNNQRTKRNFSKYAFHVPTDTTQYNTWRSEHPALYFKNKLRECVSRAKCGAIFALDELMNDSKTDEIVKNNAKKIIFDLLSVERWYKSWELCIKEVVQPAIDTYKEDDSMKELVECLEDTLDFVSAGDVTLKNYTYKQNVDILALLFKLPESFLPENLELAEKLEASVQPDNFNQLKQEIH